MSKLDGIRSVHVKGGEFRTGCCVKQVQGGTSTAILYPLACHASEVASVPNEVTPIEFAGSRNARALATARNLYQAVGGFALEDQQVSLWTEDKAWPSRLVCNVQRLLAALGSDDRDALLVRYCQPVAIRA